MISIKNISKWYGGFQVLTNCSTEVKKGEVVVVCGPSGSGKSTLIKCVNGLEPFQKGEITVDGISVGDPKTDLPKLRSRIGMVFQNFELFPHMSVMRNLTLAQVKVLGRGPDEATQKGAKLLERVGLAAHKDKYPGQLSGGQQQRVAIARALAMDPIAMLFDEPTSALGPAAFAQSCVLAAFRGGMALGAWPASRWSTRLKNLLVAYGWIEAAIGVAALIFHESFVLLTQISLDHVIPALGSPSTVEIYKYSLCTLLIVPQTVLLGLTFPLLSGAIIRRGPEASGHHLAMLYFTNSIGAAAAALASAFLLLGWLGIPGTMRLAGALNLALAVAVLAIARSGEPAPLVAQPRGGAKPLGTYLVPLFLAGAFVTGLSSFVYEIAWIRMLSLVLGSSFQAFELMLSAFITGLALGSLWIRRRIDKIADPVRYAGLVQLGMGLAALATIFVYHWTFDWMAWALAILQHNDSAYPIFNLFSHALAFAVMLPATFLAGMTLPLFTHVLLNRLNIG